MAIEMTGDQRAENIAVWLEGLAAALDRRAKADPTMAADYTGAAAAYRARASDIRAGIDLPAQQAA